MKRLVFWQLFVAALLLTSNSHAQSIKDLFNKENIEKAVNAVTGKSTADMTGTWSYTGSAIEFESDNLLQKAGGAVAATAAEKKLDEQLAKVGIKAGQMSFTFNAEHPGRSKVILELSNDLGKVTLENKVMVPGAIVTWSTLTNYKDYQL